MISVTGLKSLSEADEHVKRLECKIRKNNNLHDNEVINIENTGKSREDFAFYTTICYYLEKGEYFEKMKYIF
jgi:hypothetical protein